MMRLKEKLEDYTEAEFLSFLKKFVDFPEGLDGRALAIIKSIYLLISNKLQSIPIAQTSSSIPKKDRKIAPKEF